MPLYKTVTIDSRGPEPEIRIRAEANDQLGTIEHTISQEDLLRIRRFPLETVALRYFEDEDNAWVLSDINDVIFDPATIKIGDKVQVPKGWGAIVASNKKTQPTGRTR